jgi:tight adherence protein B
MEMITGLVGNLFYVFLVLALIAFVLLLEGLYLAWNAYRGPEAKRIEQRLRAMSAVGGKGVEASLLKRRMLSEVPLLERWLLGLPRVHELDRLLQQSGLRWSVAFFIGLSAALGIAILLTLGAVPYLHWMLQLAGATSAAALPGLYVFSKRTQRLHRIEQQLPETLDLISRALKAGHAFPSALHMAAEEVSDPIGGELRIVHDEINYGVAIDTALTNFAVRVPSTDIRYFVVSVLIQRETGGNLTELLGGISTLVRERLKLLGRVRVLSAEGRMSAWILGALPVVVGAIINLINPKFMSVLWTDPLGLKLIYAAVVMMILGALTMRKIIKIRV